MTRVVLALAILVLAAAVYTTQEDRMDLGSDPITEIARMAHGGAVIPGHINRHESRLRALERRGQVDGMVFRTKYAEALGEVSTSSVGPVDLGGPSVTVTIPEGGALIEIYAEADLHGTGATPTSQVSLLGPGTNVVIMTYTFATYATRTTAPDGVQDGQPSGLGGPIRFFRGTPGEVTYTMQYGNGGAGTGFFRNRRLWVGVARAGT